MFGLSKSDCIDAGILLDLTYDFLQIMIKILYIFSPTVKNEWCIRLFKKVCDFVFV